MKKNVKRVLTLTLALLMLLTPMNVFAKRHQKRDMPLNGIIVNDHIVLSESAPYIKNRRTFVPIRFIAEELGYEVKWFNDTNSASMNDGTTSIMIKVGSKTMLVNGERYTLELPAEITNRRTYVPLRAITEAFGKYIDFSNQYKAVGIGSGIDFAKDYKIVYYYDKIKPVITDYTINLATYSMTANGFITTYNTASDLMSVVLNDFGQYKSSGMTQYGLSEYVKSTQGDVAEDKKLKDEYYVASTSDPLVGTWYGASVFLLGNGNYYDTDVYTYIVNLGANKYKVTTRVILSNDKNSEYFTEQYGYYDVTTNTFSTERSYSQYGHTGYFKNVNPYALATIYHLNEEKTNMYEEADGKKYYNYKY